MYPEHQDQPYVDITAVGLWISRHLPTLPHLHFECRHSRTFSNPSFDEHVAMEATSQDFAALLGMLSPKLVTLRVEACDDVVDVGVLGALWCLTTLRTLRLHDLSYPIDVRRLSAGIRHLSCLRHLDLSCAAPQHSWGLEMFPPLLCTLPALRALRLINQRDVESLPSDISRLGPTLEELVLRDCGISSLPPSLSALSSLTLLAVEGVRHLAAVSLVLGDWLFALSSLRSLSLRSSLLGSCPPVLGTLGSLTMLDLSSCGLSGLPHQLSGLEALQVFNLAGNALDSFPNMLSVLRWSLRRLDLYGNRLGTGPPAKQLPPLHHLTWLDLSRNCLQAVPPHLPACTALVHLFLGGNQLEALPRDVSRLSGLERVDLRKNLLPEVPGALRALSYLQQLTLDGNPLRLTTPGAQVLLGLPRLWKLSARGCRPSFPLCAEASLAEEGMEASAPAVEAGAMGRASDSVARASCKYLRDGQQREWCQLALQLADMHGHVVLQAEGV